MAPLILLLVIRNDNAIIVALLYLVAEEDRAIVNQFCSVVIDLHLVEGHYRVDVLVQDNAGAAADHEDVVED